MAALYDQISEAVGRYLSPVNAQAILRQVAAECGRTPQTLAPNDMAAFVPKLERAVMLFLDVTKRRALRADIDKLHTTRAASSETVARARSVEIRTEQDISEARLLARQLCLELNAKSLTIQKVATVVSELARNIVSYTRGGKIEIQADTSKGTLVSIRATDQGPGIPNLDEIMSGRYRSKTGLGLGILGTKRLADRFDIRSDVNGTCIEVGVRL